MADAFFGRVGGRCLKQGNGWRREQMSRGQAGWCQGHRHSSLYYLNHYTC